MASKSERDAQNDRAALPFEPGRKREKDKESAAGSSKSEAKKAARKSSKRASSEQDKLGEESAVSAKAQARVDDIRAANRRRQEKTQVEKAEAKEANAKSGPDSDGSIPKAVSRRMVRRMAILSISPVAVGVSIFFLSYYLLSNQIVTFAPVVVLLTTMGCFGLGVVGLTYGMLSASWDDEPGSWIGLDEFKLNFGRIMDARKASKT
ncbi:MAG: PAM68 family protein [Phormidesmis sp.]